MRRHVLVNKAPPLLLQYCDCDNKLPSTQEAAHRPRGQLNLCRICNISHIQESIVKTPLFTMSWSAIFRNQEGTEIWCFHNVQSVVKPCWALSKPYVATSLAQYAPAPLFSGHISLGCFSFYMFECFC